MRWPGAHVLFNLMETTSNVAPRGGADGADWAVGHICATALSAMNAASAAELAAIRKRFVYIPIAKYGLAMFDLLDRDCAWTRAQHCNSKRQLPLFCDG